VLPASFSALLVPTSFLPAQHARRYHGSFRLPSGLCFSVLQVRSIKAAEASSESKYLAGQGFARFFIAIAAGAREAVKVAVTGR
jgi:hypothetical protein